jgi:hypothetical protein
MTWLISAEKAREMQATAVPNPGFEDIELRILMRKIFDASMHGYSKVFTESMIPYNEKRLKYLGYSVLDGDANNGIPTIVGW